MKGTRSLPCNMKLSCASISVERTLLQAALCAQEVVEAEVVLLVLGFEVVLDAPEPVGVVVVAVAVAALPLSEPVVVLPPPLTLLELPDEEVELVEVELPP